MPRRIRRPASESPMVTIRRSELDRMVRSSELQARMLRHEQRVNLSRMVDLASPVLRRRISISNAQLARALDCSIPRAISVRHAFHVRTEMMVDRIMERYHRGQSLKKADLARDLALTPDEADWIASKAADRIEHEIRLKKKKK